MRESAIVIGDSISDNRAFVERNIALQPAAIAEAPKFFNFTKAIIVAGNPKQFGLVKDCCRKIFPAADDHGLARVIIVHSEDDFIQVDAIQKEEAGASRAEVFLLSSISTAAEYIARFRIGPAPGALKIEPATVTLDDDEVLLMRRAFYDCERIYLETLGGGKASMSVYRVHAWMKQSEVGPLPLPFFAKIAKPEEVNGEKQNYRSFAEHYIPFNLRPNIERIRCVQTRAKAALIGNFVDDAVPLRQALRTGHGIGSIFSLFETTLRGFRLQPFASAEQRKTAGLDDFVSGRIKIDELLKRDAVVKRAGDFGLIQNPQVLHDKICAAAKEREYFSGPSHGDLHTGNVMVRGGDSILIDFGSTTHGPLTADPATLEASLIFGTESHEKEADFGEWKAFVDEVYGDRVATLHPPALFETRPGKFSWLRRSLRELRHVFLACEGSGEEAKILLATYLMRYARLDIETLSSNEATPLAADRHCYALVIAERIVNGFA